MTDSLNRAASAPRNFRPTPSNIEPCIKFTNKHSKLSQTGIHQERLCVKAFSVPDRCLLQKQNLMARFGLRVSAEAQTLLGLVHRYSICWCFVFLAEQ